MSASTSALSRLSHTDWEQIMAQYDASGLKQRTFCTQHGIAYSTFCYWRKRLRQSTIASHAEPVVELPMSGLAEPSEWRVELDLGQGVVLRLK